MGGKGRGLKGGGGRGKRESFVAESNEGNKDDINK